MRGINQVFLMGHLGHEPELRTTASGKSVCDIRIATHRSSRGEGGWESHTDWHRVRLWDRHAEIAERHLSKGHPVAIQGTLRSDSWTDTEGQARRRTVIYCQKLHLVRGARSTEPHSSRARQSPADQLQQDLAEMPPALAAPGVTQTQEGPF